MFKRILLAARRMTRYCVLLNIGKRSAGRFRQTLVFDSKLTTYENLAALDADGITFITLRRRGKNLVEQAESIPK